MSKRITVSIMSYLEYEALQRLLPNLTEEMKIPQEDIFIFDGAWKDYPDKKMLASRLSWDGSIEFIQDNYQKINLIKMPEVLEPIRALNWRLYTLGKNNVDATVSLDTDEYLTGNWQTFSEKVEKYLIQLENEPLLANLEFEDHDGVYDFRLGEL